MLTDLVQIRQLGLEKLNDNLEFHHRLARSPGGFAPIEKATGEFARQIECVSCGNCCRWATPPVSGREIAAIAKHFRLTAREVREKYTWPDDERPRRRKLRSNKDGCVFLSGNLCLVYPARPYGCHAFPPIAKLKRQFVHEFCRWGSLCPIVYNAIEACKERLGYRG